MSTPSVHLAVLVVATDPAKADLGTAMIVRGRANGAGHQIVQQTVTKDAEANIRSNLARWIDDPEIDVVLVIGAVESDTVPSAIRPLVTQKLDGFTDLFRYLAFQELGAGAMLSNAEAAQCGSTFVFVLPGGVGAVGTAMDKLLIPQLDRNTQPKNLVAQMPRLANALVEADLVEDAVPATVPPEKTAGGSGVPAKLPAGRAQPVQPATAKNVVRRSLDDPPTKQIDVAKLERQLERSRSPNDAQTKPAIDLRKMLPKLPPGASIDPDTDVELLAAPPPPLAGTSRIDTSPPIPPPRALPSIKGNAFGAKEGTSPGTPAPSAKPLPSLTGMKGSAFEAKESTSPGAPAKPSTGTRSRPISVPPTNTFGKEGTSPGTPAPTHEQTAQTNIGSGRDRTSPGTPAPTRDQTAQTNIGPGRDGTGRTNIGNEDPTSRTNALSRNEATSRTSALAHDEAPTTRRDDGPTTPRDEGPTTRRDEGRTNVFAKDEATNRVIPLTQDDARTKIFAKEGTSPGTPAPARGTGPSPVAPPSKRMPTGPSPVAPPPPPPAAIRAKSEAGATKAEAAKSEPVKIAPTKAEPVKIAPTKAEPPKEPQRPISSGMLGLPSSQIFANAAKEAEPLKANGKSASLTPSVEMAPLVDATLEDDDEDLDDEALLAKAKAAHAAEEAAAVPRAEKAKAKEAPLKEKSPPPNRKWEPTQKVDPMPTTREMRASSGELPIGTFQYPVQKRSSGALKWMLLLFALGAGFGAVVFVAPKLMSKGDDKKPAAKVAETTQPVQPTQPPQPPPPPETGSAEAPAIPQAGSAETTPETPTTNTPDTTPTTGTPSTHTQTTNQTKRGGNQTKRGGTTPPATGSAGTTPENTQTTTTPPPDKPIETKQPPSGDTTCDEVSCVLSKYDRPCCERYKPKNSDIGMRSGSVPEDLDRQAVRSGIDKVKPAVVQCGEKAGVKGTVKISVTVAPEGNVTASEVAEAPDPALGSCVAAAIKRASFSKSVNGGSFTYPFVF